MKTLLVAAGLITDKQNRVLLAQRPEGKALSGMWEFPGGKIEPEESPEEALVRELKEELSIDVEVESLVPLTFVTHQYNHFRLLMLLYHCPRWTGEAHGHEGQEIRWVSLAEMDALPMPPADKPLVEFLKKQSAK